MGSCFALNISFFHREWKITPRSDSEMLFLVLWPSSPKGVTKNIVFIWGDFLNRCLLAGSILPIYVSTPTLSYWVLVKQITYTPRVGFMVFMPIVKNSATVGRGMPAGSDSLPLVSSSDTYRDQRSTKNGRIHVGESRPHLLISVSAND